MGTSSVRSESEIMMPFRSIADELGKFKAGTLHSGSPSGKIVTNPAQAKAIALSEAREAGVPGVKRRPASAKG